MQETTHEITAANIEAESYFNLVQLCRLTGYANPIGAIKANGETWTVTKDECGNLLQLVRKS
jgi:prophage antirepressor-like protein